MSIALFPLVFDTARLHAQRMDEAHLPLIAAMHADGRLMATMGGTRDLTASQLYLERNVAHWNEHGFGMYMLSERDGGAPVGRAGLKRAIAREGIELAYAFLPGSWGRGYATEIAQALLALGFGRLPVDALAAVALDGNAASCRVLEKCGMRHVATQGAGSAGKRHYEIRRAEWRVAATA
ncbi:GNAT family acetyltraansferase [Achromobacter sp. RTa]|uniref:GNAT family N-acetyltransferase n=1 Tax=Achromobacter sp. RTa TaxID=1532557 RepID=UPI0005101B63|nr:GNAT family N-acetyltransferase [Achromobacter sp. RTa]KGD99689.1 GNAT family acetyltraansferase [Achromobacter sp. RTa]